MALSATFTANFASFYDAVDKADTKLKDFGAGADKVGGRLTALGNSFSGVKLIQDALLMVKAVEDIGGASKLTEKELARLGATTNEAVAKMRALGLEVPQNLQRIADQTKIATKSVDDLGASVTKVKAAAKDASTGMDGIVGSVKGIAGALGIGLSVKSVLDFGKAVIDDAGHIADLSSKIGISTDAVQRFGFAAEQSGGSMDVVGAAISKMNVTLAGGDKSTVAALDAIGVKFSDIRAMKPEDAFTTITKAIAGIADPMAQAEAATKLFGKTGQELLPAIKQGFVDAAASAPVMADAVIQAADRIGDRLARLKRETLNAGGELIGGLELMVETSYSYIDELNTKAFQSVEERAKHAKDSIAAIATALGTDKSDLSGYLGGFGMDLGGPKTMADDLRIATAAMKDLTAEQRKNIDAGIALGNSADDIAAKTHIAADVVKLYTDQQKKSTDAEKKATDAATEHLKKIDDLAASLSGVGLTQKTKDLNEAVALSALVYGRAALNTQATVDAVRALAREGAALPPLLRDIYLRHLDWAGAGVKVEVGIKSILTDLPNYTQQLKNFMNVQFFNFKLPDFKTQLGNLFQDLPNLAPQFKQWGAQNITEPMRRTVEETQAVLQLIGAAFDALGQHGGAAFQLVTQMAEIAIKGLIAYRAATEAAQKATIALSVATGVATAGIGFVVGQVLSILAQTAAAERQSAKTLKELQDAIIAFGATPTTVPAIVDSWLGPEKSLHKALMDQLAELQKAADARAKALDSARTDVGKLQSALEVFGGVVPAALRPAIAAILAIPGIPPDLAKSLADLAKDPNWQTLETDAKNLGIDLKAAGKEFNQAKFGDIGLEYARKLHEFADAGFDMQLVIEGMSDELSDLYNNAQKTGVKLPDTLKPYMATLVAQGRLLDDNGNKIDHLNEDSFADIEDKGLKDVVSILEEIAQLLRDGLPKAADTGAKGVQEAFEKHPVVIPVEWKYPGAPAPPPGAGPGSPDNPGVPPPGPGGPGRQPGPGMESYQGGTDGFVNFGRGTPVVLHGWEAVVPRGQALASSAPIDITVISQLDGREVARNQVRYIPRELSRAGL